MLPFYCDHKIKNSRERKLLMSPRIFTTTQREELRIRMLDAGFELIKKHGMTHASVEKITQAAGLGKSTFYNFFSSKEEFVTDIMEYQRDREKQHFEHLLDGREKMTAAEGREYLKLIVFSQTASISISPQRIWKSCAGFLL
jgi:AcrR family transcriptional regulator